MTKAKSKKSAKKSGMAVPVDNDKKWRAECDARTLSEAKVIQGDKGRMKEAVKAAKKMAQEKEKEALAMKNVAKVK